MATKGKKVFRWTQAEEERLIANVEKHVLCLTKAFEITSKELQRTPGAVANHWYSKTSVKGGKTLFGLVSGTYLVVNRKNAKEAKADVMPVNAFHKILKLLGLK